MRWRRTAAAGVLAVLVGAVFALARGPEVEVRRAARGPIAEWVEDRGRARVRERHVLSAPVPGALERVEVHPGDRVRTGDVVAHLLPMAPEPLDARARAEAEARLVAARAAEREARATLRRAQVAEADAARAVARSRTLHAGAALSARELESAEATALGSAEQVRAARAAAERARGDRIAIEALLGPPTVAPRETIPLAAPVGGVVLRVAQESAGPVAPGAPIVEIGDPVDLEVALELLTEQAARVRTGAPVEITAWGGDAPLAGVVRRVEPSAFTKVSALGVEEQRVLVLVDPAGDRAAWAPLGDGWRVEGRIAVAQRPDAVKVSSSSVVRGERGWFVFVVDGVRARRREVRVGTASGDEVEVASGLREGELVLLRPTSEIVDGMRVRPR